jgi:hypothetical protein
MYTLTDIGLATPADIGFVAKAAVPAAHQAFGLDTASGEAVVYAGTGR